MNQAKEPKKADQKPVQQIPLFNKHEFLRHTQLVTVNNHIPGSNVYLNSFIVATYVVLIINLFQKRFSKYDSNTHTKR